MDTRPLISVILPVYNVEKYLKKCMNSVLSQTYSNLEIILVDDGSTDSCPALCEEFARDERVIVYHKANGGLSDARNYGIERAKGEYITLIDSDDYVDTDYIEYLFALLTKYETRMAIAQHRVHYNNGSVKENSKIGNESMTAEQCLESLLYHDTIDTSAWGKLYHRYLFREVRYPKGKIFEDIGTTYALIFQCDYIAIGYESKYNYVFHDNSIVNSAFSPSKLDLIEMTDKMAQDVVIRYPELKQAVLRRQVYARISTLNQMLDVKDYSEEKENILNFVRYNKWNIIRDCKAPKRDKIALILLNISFSLYKAIWMLYRRRKMQL